MYPHCSAQASYNGPRHRQVVHIALQSMLLQFVALRTAFETRIHALVVSQWEVEGGGGGGPGSPRTPVGVRPPALDGASGASGVRRGTLLASNDVEAASTSAAGSATGTASDSGTPDLGHGATPGPQRRRDATASGCGSIAPLPVLDVLAFVSAMHCVEQVTLSVVRVGQTVWEIERGVHTDEWLWRLRAGRNCQSGADTEQ